MSRIIWQQGQLVDGHTAFLDGQHAVGSVFRVAGGWGWSVEATQINAAHGRITMSANFCGIITRVWRGGDLPLPTADAAKAACTKYIGGFLSLQAPSTSV